LLNLIHGGGDGEGAVPLQQINSATTNLGSPRPEKQFLGCEHFALSSFIATVIEERRQTAESICRSFGILTHAANFPLTYHHILTQ